MDRTAKSEPMRRRTGLPAVVLAVGWLVVEAGAALVGVSSAAVPARAQFFDFFSRPPGSIPGGYQQRYRPQPQQRGFGFPFFGGNSNYQQYDPWAPPRRGGPAAAAGRAAAGRFQQGAPAAPQRSGAPDQRPRAGRLDGRLARLRSRRCVFRHARAWGDAPPPHRVRPAAQRRSRCLRLGAGRQGRACARQGGLRGDDDRTRRSSSDPRAPAGACEPAGGAETG